MIDPTTGATTLVGAHGAGVQFAKGFEIAVGAAGGSIQMIQASGCAGSAPLTLQFTGSPTIGNSVTETLTGVTGVPFYAYNFGPPSQPLAPACACFVSGTSGWNFGATSTLTIPNSPAFQGLVLLTQGVELLPAAPSCVSPAALNFSDIWAITIG